MFNKILFATTGSPTCDNAAKVAFDLEEKWDTYMEKPPEASVLLKITQQLIGTG